MGVKPALVESAASLSLSDQRDTRVVVVADTHSAPHPAFLDHLSSLRPDAILHAGDIGDLTVLDPLAEVAPLFAVRGNIDTRASAVPDIVILDLQGRDRALRLLLIHIAVYGPRLRADVARQARRHGASLVVCGHSHVPFIGQHGNLTVFNPGSVGPRRGHLPILFGTLDITARGARLAHIDCETGRPWSPP